MSLSNILESNNPITPQPWTLLHAQRYKGLELDVGKLENVVTVNGDPISEYKLQIDNAPAAGTQLLTEIAPRNYQIKTLQAGSGVSLVDSPDSVQINSTANTYSLSAARFGVDNSSNPGPVINGLLFDPTLTTAGTFAIPLTASSVGLGIADNYEDDIDNYFTITSPTTIQINVTGKYHLSGCFCVASNDLLNPVLTQITRNSDPIFSAPAASTNFTNASNTTGTPISGLYTYAYSMTNSVDALLTAGDIINVKLFASGGSGGDTAEITLTSALCIHLIGGTSSGAGSSGVTAVNSLGTGETLLNPSGAGPVLGIKSLVAGANVTLTPTGNDITISSAGGGGSANFYFAIGSPPIEDGAFVTDGTLQLSVLAFDDVGGQNNIIRDPISPFGLQVNNKVAIFSFTIQVISVIPTGYPYYPVEFYIRNETSGIYYIAGYTNAVGTIGLTRILPAFPNAKWNLYVRGPAAPSAAEICPISISIWTIT